MKKNKVFHEIYSGATEVLGDAECSECDRWHVKVVRIIAEHNAGEVVAVDIFQDCLVALLKMLVLDTKSYK